MDFSAPPWLFLLIAVPGLWLAARLYGRGPRGLVLPAAAAWLLLALFAASPLWRARGETWHPPLVVLAVDETPSYAALGARDSAARLVRAARGHYEALGFRVVETGYGGAASGAREKRGGGGAALPNLQAVLLWTDGRLAGGEGADGEAGSPRLPAAWTAAPVFPVSFPASGGEVQGEQATADLSDPAGATLTIAWRSIGAPAGAGAGAMVELRDGGRVLWTAALPHPSGTVAGELVSSRLTLPPRVAERLAAAPATLLLRPAAAGANAIVKNDTVPIQGLDGNRPVPVLIRPLGSLEERGLIDALREENAPAPAALAAASLRPLPGTVVWMNARAAGDVAAAVRSRLAGAPLVLYEIPGGASSLQSAAAFGPDARLAWRADGAEFLPPGALRLGDLGADNLVLRAPDASVEALAWVETDEPGQGKRNARGLLFWRHRDDGRFGFAVPPLWRSGFRPGPAAGGPSAIAGAWTRGAGAWARALSLRRGDGAAGRGPGASRDLRAPHGGELARLGADGAALARLARGTDGGGRVISFYGNDYDKILWPALPGGQVREIRGRVFPLTPPVATALAIALCFSVLWVLRKRLQLD